MAPGKGCAIQVWLVFNLALGRAKNGNNRHYAALFVVGALYWFFFFAFAHRAWAARRADSRRCCGVNL